MEKQKEVYEKENKELKDVINRMSNFQEWLKKFPFQVIVRRSPQGWKFRGEINVGS